MGTPVLPFASYMYIPPTPVVDEPSLRTGLHWSLLGKASAERSARPPAADERLGWEGRRGLSAPWRAFLGRCAGLRAREVIGGACSDEVIDWRCVCCVSGLGDEGGACLFFWTSWPT